MTRLRTAVVAAIILATVAATAQADYTYVGADGGEFFTESNWLDDMNAMPADGEIDNGVDLSMNAAVTGTTGLTATAAGFTGIYMGGNTLTLDNTSLVVTGSGGFRHGFFDLLNGTTADVQFIGEHIQVNVDATSSISFRGGGNPINTGEDTNPAPGPENTRVNLLDVGATLVFLNENTTDAMSEHIDTGKILVNGETAIVGTNITLEAMGNGSVIRATVPEPSGLLLLMAGLVFSPLCAARRRNRS